MIFSFVQFIIPFILVLANSTTFVYSFTNITDQQSLLSIKASITADPLGVLDSWNNSVHFCHWTGVTCSRRRQRVTALKLSSQQLGGALSPHIGNLSFIREIDIYQNNFHGSIPNEIGRLFRLQHLSLTNNSFQGGFPVNLSHCVNIRFIALHNNHLQGNLPTEFASWPKLYLFDLGENHFSGPIPSSIENISSLRILYLDQNNLGSGIPLEIAHLAKLKVLSLGGNNLSGIVPLPLYNSSSLDTVGLTQNELEGTFPADLGFTLPKLQRFYADYNKFSGPLPSSIPNASNLVIFDIVDNNITGPIPNNLGSLPNLQILGLGYNPLGDNMRPDALNFYKSLVNCTLLYFLGLAESGLRGELPYSIVNLSTSMEVLHLYGNHIHGSIPREIGKLENIIILTLNDNYLTGAIPESFGELSKLGALDLGNNNISGVIPNSISNITQLSALGLYDNMLRGSIPTELFNISTLQRLSLTKNRLRGVIPEEIVFSSQFISLDLSRNLFNGSLPFNIGRLKQLVQLDVSHNKLTGDIPATLGGCVMLEELYMQGNLFQGEGRYGSVYKGVLESVEHIVAVKVLNVEVHGANKSFLAECETLRNIRHRNLIKIITACSSIDFKGNDFKALIFEFMTNGSVDNWLHPSTSNQGNERNLTLLQRLNISIDVALGVDYLHHHSHTSIIHSDLKPSNILLDHDFVAHIGDFGLARFSFATTSDNQAQMSSTGLRGTVGYVPPEYGMCGEISTEGDVYSYGIFLLEFFSGKRPTEISILTDGGTTLHDYVRKALPQRVMDIADPRIVLDQEEHGLTVNQSYSRSIMEVCLASIFEVGIFCSEERPQKRVDISVAIKLLHVARDKLMQSRQ